MLRKLEKFSLPEIEEKALEFWKQNGIFEKSLSKNNSKSRKSKTKNFVFYEGPPTANGRPGIHHVLARAFKDIVLRYKTMRGFVVPRQGGWDTHGLPVELGVEKALGLKSKKEIEKYGVAEFNQKCKESVWQYKEEWEKLTERIGFWLDLKNPYITYENSYIESVWGIIKKVWKKNLLYKGRKVVPWCARCGTALSSHELALGYKEIEDTSVYVKFKIKNQKSKIKINDSTYILSWTTTPWTLPGNVALAINQNVVYCKIKYQISLRKNKSDTELVKSPGRAGPDRAGPDRAGPDRAGKNNEFYILAKERLSVISEPYEIINEFLGKDLIGLEYEPLFKIPKLKTKTSYKIYPADFVTVDDGAGVVHTAVMYGEDDYNLGKKIGLSQFHTVAENGRFIKEIPEVGGMYAKDKTTEEKIIKYLQAENYLLKIQPYKHEYPFCWRCGTALLYYARDSWFIAMSQLKNKLMVENEKINWIPENIKHGRFGEWLKDIKDWAISRERYWGTPLPIWECGNCENLKAVGSIEELSETYKSQNRYIFIRHGESEHNISNIISNWPEKKKYHLTIKGKIQVEKLTEKLRKDNIDFIFASPITRTKETAQLLSQFLKIKKVFYDERLLEINTGDFNGCHDNQYHEYFVDDMEKFSKQPPNGETLTDLRTRLFDFLNDLEKKYKNKIIAIVSHEYPIWMLQACMMGWSDAQAVKEKHARDDNFIETSEAREIEFRFLPRDKTGLFDLHKPYIDKITFSCEKCGKQMKRAPEVIDVWFDSGAMPFTQTSDIRHLTSDYPADYIAEGIDQTRGWFYTLLAIGVLMDKGTPYKNVISLGLILDKNGQKMSKSKGNTVDPWAIIQKYGTDTARWYFYTVNPPGEPKKFDEADLGKILRQFIMLIYNSFVFYDTYAHKHLVSDVRGLVSNTKHQTSNILDKWILARLNETIEFTTKKLEKYEIGESARKIEEFAGDLSRWYIRRSRRRLQKPESKQDYEEASQTLEYALITVAKLLAPFTPFFAEALYHSFDAKYQTSSVHLENWPETDKKLIDKKLLEQMAEIRRLATLALAKRAEAKIKVRQPLSELRFKNKDLRLKNDLLDILKDEVNVKNVVFDKNLKEEIELNTNITHELKEEGWFREFIRIAQELRQDAGLEPRDKIILMMESAPELHHVLEKFEQLLKREINAEKIEYKKSEKFTAEFKTKLDEWDLWVALRKV